MFILPEEALYEAYELVGSFEFGVVAAVCYDFKAAVGDAVVVSHSLYGMKKRSSRAAVSCCSSSVMNASRYCLLVSDCRC